MLTMPSLPTLRATVPAVILILGILLTVLAAVSAHREGERREALQFASVADGVRNAIESRLEAYIAMLRGAAGLFAASDDVSPAEFREYIARLELPIRYPGIQGIGFSAVVPSEARERVAARIRAEGVPFEYRPATAGDETVHAIVYLEPLDARNLWALGYDMFSEPVRRAAMEAARDRAEPAASGRVRLVQEEAEPGREQYGFLIYLPVFVGGATPPTVEERRVGLLGFVYSPFRAGDLLRGILSEGAYPGVGLEVHDGDGSGDALLHRSGTQWERPGTREERRPVTVAGRPWTLVIRAAPRTGISFRDLFVMVIAAGGTLLAVLLAGATRAEMRGREAAERQAAELQASEEALRRAHQAKDDFLAMVSHELRTPLNAILGWSSMLLRGQVPLEGRPQALETIHRNARAQVKLVEDLLDMSRAVAGRLRLEVQPTDVAAVLRNALEAVRPSADVAGVRLEWQGGEELGLIQADPGRLEQIVWNLLSNAIKFTPAGGVVRLAATRQWRELEIEVSDTGIGIPADLLPHVFDPFRQGDPSTTRAHGGIGLGLAIVRHIVDLHGGTITAANDGRTGAVFTVRLPVEAPARPAPQ
jgi:signal transduction histidine kinase/type II secretory pathway pseudopilin PulG